MFRSILKFKKKRDPDSLLASGDPAKLFQKELFRALIKFAIFLVLGGGLVTSLLIISSKEAKSLTNLRGERQWISLSFDAISRLSGDEREAVVLRPLLEQGLPTLVDIPTKVIPRIQKLGQENKVRVASQVGTLSPATDGQPPSVAISIRFDGSVLEVVRFVGVLEKENLVFRFDSVELSQQKSGGIYQVVLAGKLYLR